MSRSHILPFVSYFLVQAVSAQTFWNFETPPVHPVEMTPDGSKLLIANTADGRVEVFSLAGGTPIWTAAIPVGIDPVSVRARNDTEVWVVNQISDSVSIVSLTTNNVVYTLFPGDEPADVAFAGNPQRAFVTVSQRNQVKVYDPNNHAAASGTIAIAGEDPRALVTDGTRVYAAIFESGNHTTIIPATTVSAANGPYAGQNPPPNSGTSFNPPLTTGLPTPPAVGLIVRKQGTNWMDDNNHNWNAKIPWDVLDNDVAIIDAATLAVTYAKNIMTIDMNLAVQPGTGRVTVVGTEATNATRFEPNISGRFVRVKLGTIDPATGNVLSIADLNPHLTYATSSVPMDQRVLSIGDPRDIVWVSATRGYVCGMGSNNVIGIDATGSRQSLIDVGDGPAGLAYDAPRNRLYVLNRFDGTLSIIDAVNDVELSRVPFFDPTPATIKSGRPQLYDTHATSGLGQVSCASCHVDANFDNIAWDLGNPAGQVKTFDQSCNGGLAGGCENWHPMKGPMTTQTLIGIIGTEPFHWRGDRENLEAFTVGFTNLLAADAPPTDPEMTAFQNFLATIHFPPQPNRTFSDGLPTSVPGVTGNPQNGFTLFTNNLLDGGALRCVDCHTLPTGSQATIISGNALQESQSFKVPELRNMYEKTDFSFTSTTSTHGFGFVHDGSVDTLFNFLKQPVFSFPSGATGDNQRNDIAAFLMCFPSNTHAAVGAQITFDGGNNSDPNATALLNNMLTLANSGVVGLVAKGRAAGIARGYVYVPANGNFQSDRQSETIGSSALRSNASAGNEMTFTVVAPGTQTRIGIDRDGDGYLDRDELEACSNPNDAAVIPAPSAPLGDLNGTHTVDISDLAILLSNYGKSPAMLLDGDLDGNGLVDLVDLSIQLSNYGRTCP